MFVSLLTESGRVSAGYAKIYVKNTLGRISQKNICRYPHGAGNQVSYAPTSAHSKHIAPGLMYLVM